MTWKRILLIGAVLLALGMTGMQATPAHAASTLTVSTCDESHLSAAVTQANTDNDGDRITFRCNGTITLTSTLSIIGSMTIDGTGQNVIIDGGGNVELINVSAALELDQLTLSGGSNTFGAGVFNNHGTLNTIATTFSNDTATSGSGGAIYNNGGTALIQGSTFSGNSAQNGAPGGAIENVAGQVTIIASSFSNNTGGYGGGAINNEGGGTVNVSGGSSFSTDSGGYGGAILSIGATLSVSDSTFSGNSAANEGGAISHSADMNITNCLFLSNSAAAVGGLGGALDNEGGTSKIKGSTFQGNSAQVGGAITSSGSAIVQIDNSTFSSNTVGSASPAVTGDGGAIANGAATTITASTFSKNVAYGTAGAVRNQAGATVNVGNSTLTGNYAAGRGGGIFSYGTVNVTNSTLAGNSTLHGGGAVSLGGGTMSFGGSIVSGNTSAENSGNCYISGGAISDTGYNDESGTDCGFTGTGSLQSTDPLLDTAGLQSNGGPTQTIALQSSSLAIDQIPSASALCPHTDQRGYTRPDDSATETTCDMGAYEFNAPPPVQTALSLISGSATYGGTATLTATLKDAGNNPLGGEKISFTFGSIPLCDAAGEPACPQTGTSGVATLSGAALLGGQIHVHTYSGSLHASFAGDVGYSASTGTGNLTVAAAGSNTSASASSSVIWSGESFTVDYEVSSAFGIAGNTATGAVSIVEDSGPQILNCSIYSAGLSANQSNADGTGASNAGFDFIVNSTTNSGGEFTCAPGTPGTYTYHIHFNDTDGSYSGSNSSTLSLTVNAQVPTSMSAVIGSATYGGTATFTATLQDASNNGLNGKTVAFSLRNGNTSSWIPICGGTTGVTCPSTQTTNTVEGVATLSGITLPSEYTSTGFYSNAVQASFAGDTGDVQSSSIGSLTVAQANQSITFGALSNKTYGDPDFTVSATASSELTVSFGASGSCTVSGSTVHLTGAGSCTITASQSGDTNYKPAPDVQQSFTIAQAMTGTSLGSSVNASLVGQAVTYTATISPIPDRGTVAFEDGGSTIGCDSQAVDTTTGRATCTVTYTSAGSHSITAAYSGDTNYVTSTSSTLTQQVGYMVHSVSTKSLTIVLQLWNASNTNVSSASLAVTAVCVVSSTTVPTSCGATPVQSINQAFTFLAPAKKAGAQYSHKLSSAGLTRINSYYLLVQADGDPNMHAVQFTG